AIEGLQGEKGGFTKSSSYIEVGTNLVFVTDGVLSQTLNSFNLGNDLPGGFNIGDELGFGSELEAIVPGDFLEDIGAIGKNLDLDLFGNFVIANDIEHIIGGEGTNTFHFIDEARLQGTISGGTIVLDYAPYFNANDPPGDNAGVIVDYAAGGDTNLFDDYPGWVETLLGDDIPHEFVYGSAQGVIGNRLIPGLNQFVGSLTNHKYGVAGGSDVIGSPFNDELTGTSGDNVFVSGGGDDTINGGDGDDTLSFLTSNDGVTIDLNSGTSWAGGHRSFYFTSTQGKAATQEVVSIKREGATGGSFNLKLTGKDSKSGTTIDLRYDSTAAELREALETVAGSIPNISEIAVTGTGTAANPWIVTFLNPESGNVKLERGDVALVAGNLTVTTVTEGQLPVSEIQRLWNNADSGFFSLSYGGKASETGLAYNVPATELKTAIESLVDSLVTVTGSGTVGKPWIITFTDKTSGNVAQLATLDTGLEQASTTITTVTEGSASAVAIQTITVVPSAAGTLGGEFKLSSGTNQTNGIPYNASAREVKDALEPLFSDVRLLVQGGRGGPWDVTFFPKEAGDLIGDVNPGVREIVGVSVPLLKVVSTGATSVSLINGAVTIANGTRGSPFKQGGIIVNPDPLTPSAGGVSLNEKVAIWNNATSGKFKFVFDDPKTAGNTEMSTDVSYNASPGEIKAALEELPNITSVKVTGSGTEYDPWIVEFDGPSKTNVQDLTTEDVSLRLFNFPWSVVETETEGDREIKEVQTLKNGATGGFFTISLDDQVTKPLAHDSSAQDVEDALNQFSVVLNEIQDILLNGTVTVNSSLAGETTVTVDSVPENLTVGATLLGQKVDSISGTTLTLEGGADTTISSQTSATFTPVTVIINFKETQTSEAKKVEVDASASKEDVEVAFGKVELANGKKLEVDVTDIAGGGWRVKFRNPSAKNLPLMTAVGATVTGFQDGGSNLSGTINVTGGVLETLDAKTARKAWKIEFDWGGRCFSDHNQRLWSSEGCWCFKTYEY
ncbi:hypothetical protein N9204_01280, partial [bacterium]|nr:hypothetical protein [bacterium]